MMAIEFVALVGVLGLLALGILTLVAWHQRARHQARARLELQRDLASILFTQDYRKLDAFIAVKADDLTEAQKEQLKIVRDDLYVKVNDKP